METAQVKDTAKSRLVHDLKAVIVDAEDVLRVTANNASAEYLTAKQKLERNLLAAREELEHIEQAAIMRAKHAARATDAYVHAHPWQSVGVGAAVGLAVGVLIGRR